MANIISTDRLMAIAILALIIVSVIIGSLDSAARLAQARQLAAQSARLSELTTCQARYNQDVAQVVRLRARLGNLDRFATVALIRGVFTPPPGQTPAQERRRDGQLFTDWNRAETSYEHQLAAAKVPSLTARCGDPPRQLVTRPRMGPAGHGRP